MVRFGVIKCVLAAFMGIAMLASPSVAADNKPFFEKDVERWGSDYSIFDVQGGANTCYQACAKDKQCLAWTYHRPGTKSKSGECHLKSKVAHASSNACCISGVLVGQSALNASVSTPMKSSSIYSSGTRKASKATKARRSMRAEPSRKMFQTTNLTRGESLGLPELTVAAMAPPMKITPLSFTTSEEF